MEWLADRQRRQTCGKGYERELYPDNLLKRKKTGPFLEDWQKGLALGQELWLWSGLGGGGTWVFFGWICAARDFKLAPHSKKNFPSN